MCSKVFENIYQRRLFKEVFKRSMVNHLHQSAQLLTVLQDMHYSREELDYISNYMTDV